MAQPVHLPMAEPRRASRQLLATGLLALATAVVTACGSGNAGAAATTEAIRDTTPSGIPRITHPSLAEQVPDTLEADLLIGELDGDAPYIFGDIRGIEVGDDGSIYVVDAQAVELRAFEPDGTFRAVLAGQGEGPGEMGRTNGLVRDAEGTLWVHDHGSMQMLGFSPSGEVLRTSGVPVRSWGYVYSGGIDDQGRFWKFDAVREGDYTRPEAGLNESTARSYMKVHDPATEVTDSIFVGEATYRSWVVLRGNGMSMMGIPFTSAPRPVFDPAGGFWAVDAPEYRVVHVDAAGDTALVIRTDLARIPVTQVDRAALESRYPPGQEELVRALSEMWEHVPDEKPRATGVFLDDGGRVWVRRGSGGDEMSERPLYDVFERDGAYVTSLTPSFVPWPPLNPVVRNGHFHAVEKDELDVARIVRAPLPHVLR